MSVAQLDSNSTTISGHGTDDDNEEDEDDDDIKKLKWYKTGHKSQQCHPTRLNFRY